MREVVSYNFQESDIADGNYAALFSKRRRDAMFAFAFEEADGSLVMGRDHLGNVPLFYRIENGVIRASIFLHELTKNDEVFNEEGLRAYLSIGTVKLAPLFKDINIVPPGSVIRVKSDGSCEVLYTYRIHAKKQSGSFAQCAAEADRLLAAAIARVAPKGRVGLYLSGGIDSGLIGVYLKQLGLAVHAYTAAPPVGRGSETHFANLNAKTIGVDEHSMQHLDTSRYAHLAERSAHWYGNPNGSTSQMAILTLLESTDVAHESHVFFGQNSDTVTCTVAAQSALFFAGFVPRFVRQYLHPSLKETSLLDSFVSLSTVGMLKHFAPLEEFEKGYSRLEQLTLAGMRFAYTPVDGEILLLPHVQKNTLVSNPYYDMDLIEFCMGIPLRYRIGRARDSKIGLALVKRIFRSLARRYLPPEIVERKKGLSIPITQEEHARTFFETLPHEMHSIKLRTPGQRFAAGQLEMWLRERGISAR